MHKLPKKIKAYDYDQISGFSGEIAIVTGANTGLGYETALLLARKEIKVIMACRDDDKAERAANRIRKRVPNSDVEVMLLDLASLSSVKDFAKRFLATYDELHLLINNAGVFLPPYTKTEDGFELQFGVNYLGHFYLTGLLLPLLEKTERSRVVSVSSLAHSKGDIYFDDLQFEKRYDKLKAYAQSKLACLMFAYELQRRLDQAGYQTKSVAAHPGVTLTDIGRHLPKVALGIGKLISPLLFQSPHDGAQPLVRAALDPRSKGGEYYGPDGFRQYKGKPVRVSSNSISKDEKKASKLWEVSEQLTGLNYLD